MRLLRHVPHAPFMGDQIALDGLSFEEDLAGGHLHHPRDHFHRGGFAGAVGPEIAGNFSRPNGEADAVHGGDAGEALYDMAQFEHMTAFDTTDGRKVPPWRIMNVCPNWCSKLFKRQTAAIALSASLKTSSPTETLGRIAQERTRSDSSVLLRPATSRSRTPSSGTRRSLVCCMRVHRDAAGAHRADVLQAMAVRVKVHQVGSHIILETSAPTRQRIAIPDHQPLRLGNAQLNSANRRPAQRRSPRRDYCESSRFPQPC